MQISQFKIANLILDINWSDQPHVMSSLSKEALSVAEKLIKDEPAKTKKIKVINNDHDDEQVTDEQEPLVEEVIEVEQETEKEVKPKSALKKVTVKKPKQKLDADETPIKKPKKKVSIKDE